MPHHRQAAWKAHGRITRRHWRHVLHRIARWTRGRKTWPQGKVRGRNDHTQRCKWLSQSCGTLFQCSFQRLVLCHPAVLLNIEHVALLKPDMGLARSEHDHKVDEGWRLESKKKSRNSFGGLRSWSVPSTWPYVIPEDENCCLYSNKYWSKSVHRSHHTIITANCLQQPKRIRNQYISWFQVCTRTRRTRVARV